MNETIKLFLDFFKDEIIGFLKRHSNLIAVSALVLAIFKCWKQEGSLTLADSGVIVFATLWLIKSIVTYVMLLVNKHLIPRRVLRNISEEFPDSVKILLKSKLATGSRTIHVYSITKGSGLTYYHNSDQVKYLLDHYLVEGAQGA